MGLWRFLKCYFENRMLDIINQTSTVYNGYGQNSSSFLSKVRFKSDSGERSDTCSDARSEASTERNTERRDDSEAEKGTLGKPIVIAANPASNKIAKKPISVVNPTTGEIQYFDRQTLKPVYNQDFERMFRWLMLQQSKHILRSYPGAYVERKKTNLVPKPTAIDLNFIGPIKPQMQRVPKEVRNSQGGFEYVTHMQPTFRTVLCLERVVPNLQAEVWKSKTTQNCSWHNLIVCGSPWLCPICSEKIDHGRQEQIKAVYEAFQSAEINGSTYMLTFTVRHGLGDKCQVLVDSMKQAMRLLQKTPAFKEVTRKEALQRPQADSMPHLGYIGRIAALETTYGSNGWHPHEHHLWFFKRKLTNSELQLMKDRLFEAWAKCCVAAGMQAPTKEHGLDIRVALSAAEYLAKFSKVRLWGPEHEIASSHSKKGTAKGRSVMQILSDSMQIDDQNVRPEFHMNRDAHLFLDFAQAFFGKHQLQVSRSLKTWLLAHGVDLDETESGDQELASKVESESELQFALDENDFRRIVKHKAQMMVLLICKNSGADAALRYIKSLS